MAETDERCEACGGHGIVCSVCGVDDCDCDDRIEVECPDCGGSGQSQDDETEEQ